MKSLIKGAAAAVAIAVCVGASAAPPAAEPTPKATAVLVHGAFADGSSWEKVIPLLQAKGLNVVAVQNPLTSLDDDVAATRRVLDMQTGPVVLVGHSWGGVVISQIGGHERVKSLVYVAAFAPSEGQSVAEIGKDYPAPPGFGHLITDKDGFLTLSGDGMTKHFAQDLPQAQTRLMAVTQGPVAAKAFDEKTTVAAWKSKPSWYVVTEQDHMLQPALQRSMAEKIAAHVISIKSSHVPQLSQPMQVADAIVTAAMAK
jgi:pimeloyl-ACP methyl ester carboxylesterase